VSQAVVLVLRPQPGADETVDVLRAAGLPAEALPVIATEPLPESPALRAVVQRLDEFDAVVFVSPAAARFGLKWIDAFWPQYPLATRWLAVGERTREILAAADLDARAPDDDASAQGLLDAGLLDDAAIARVLVVRGEGGRTVLDEGLAERGVRVEHLVVHRRAPLAVTLPAQAAALVASSADVVDALLASGGARFAERPLVVPSERVAARAREAGFRRVLVAAGAGPDATRAALEDAGFGQTHRGAVP
jgi:uroporphyrinogen-III synthase